MLNDKNHILIERDNRKYYILSNIDGIKNLLIPSERYKEDEIRDGPYKRYDKDGYLISECTYKNDEKDGIHNRWYYDLNLLATSNYINGNKEYEEWWDLEEEGQVELKITINKDGEVKWIN